MKRVKYAAEMIVDGPAERAYILEHAWRQTRDKFYNPNLHGVDWPALKKNYQAKLDHISDNNDFAEILEDISIDDYVFGVAAIGADGHESLVSPYVRPPRPRSDIREVGR